MDLYESDIYDIYVSLNKVFSVCFILFLPVSLIVLHLKCQTQFNSDYGLDITAEFSVLDPGSQRKI